MLRLFKKLIVLIVLLPLVLAACGGGNNTTTSSNTSSCPASRANLKFYVITHGQASDPFWSVVKKGVDQAAHDMCVTALYESPTGTTFDVVAMSHLIDTAVAAHPNGLVVSIPDPKALGPSIKAAVAAGIPVISINSGSDVAKSLGVLVHIRQSQQQAASAGRARMAAAARKPVLCVSQEVVTPPLRVRCKGL